MDVAQDGGREQMQLSNVNSMTGTTPSAAELEAVLSRIPGIDAARVVIGSNGRVAEVHIVALADRTPKQVVRDVQTAIQATFALEVDYRAVSVVQLAASPDPGPDRQPLPTRLAVRRVVIAAEGNITEISVDLSSERAALVGKARGPATSTPRLVAQAVLDAIGGEVGGAAADVEWSGFVDGGAHHVAVVLLRLLGSRGEHLLTGSALVRKDSNDALVRATLDALNRHLG